MQSPPHQAALRGRLDSTGRQEDNGGTDHPDRCSQTPPQRRTRTLPPAPCSASPQIDSHWLWRATDGRTSPWYCARWDCPHCATILADRWAAIITVAAPQRHLILTRLGPLPEDARSQLRNITKAVRRGQFHGAGARTNHVDFEYFAALETSPSGWIHAHLLQRGSSLPKRKLSALLPRYHAGSVCWIRSISQADRPTAVARYVARHLVGHQHADQMKTGRRIRYTRQFWGGCSTAEVAAALWPRSPDPATWTLIGPPPRLESPGARELRRTDDRDAARANRLDELLRKAIMRGETEADLLRHRLIFPAPLEIDLAD